MRKNRLFQAFLAFSRISRKTRDRVLMAKIGRRGSERPAAYRKKSDGPHIHHDCLLLTAHRSLYGVRTFPCRPFPCPKFPLLPRSHSCSRSGIGKYRFFVPFATLVFKKIRNECNTLKCLTINNVTPL
jgi:hypothetical protein